MSPSHKPLLMLAVLSGIAMAGCTTLRSLPNLQPGVATEADATALAGKPTYVWQNPDGTHTLEYSQQPGNGDIAYKVTVDANDKVRKVENMVVEENAKRIERGMTHDQVRRIMGTPRRVINYALSGEEVWDWNVPFEPRDEPRVRINAHFKDDKVIRISQTEVQDCNRYTMIPC
jgi:hypothetical protein